MTNKFVTCRKAVSIVIAAAVLTLSSPAFAASTFFNPKHGGYRLDWCFTWAQNCGKPVADHFCQIKGYNRALQHKIDHDVGVPTRLISNGNFCNQHFCDSFKYIQCTG